MISSEILKETIRKHEQELDKTMKTLDHESLVMSFQKCEFAKNKIYWLVFAATSREINLLVTKTESLWKIGQ